MDPDERKLLQKTYALSEENNKILRGLRNANRWSSFFRVIYWILIIVVSVGIVYYVQPYINSLISTYQSIQAEVNTAKSITTKIQ